jgi:recombination protein RecA
MSSVPLNASPPAFWPAALPARNPQASDKRASVLKHVARSEHLIAVRPASQLEVRPRPEMLSTGIVELDAMTGGIPRGCLTEICGPGSSGKTSVLLATISATTRREESCVLIDASDSFDPSSGAAAGVDLTRLLWIRCGNPLSSAISFRSSGKKTPSVVGRLSSPHPDNSAFPNRAYDERRTTDDVCTNARLPMTDDRRLVNKKLYSEKRLAQVLKATDLILQSGGFGLVALDLAGVSEKFVRRIPLASWFRFQRAVEHTKTALLVVSESPCAQTCAALAMKIYGKPSAVSHLPAGGPSHAQVLKKMQVEVEILRSRLERKPVQSATAIFRTQAVRAG